MTDDAIYKRIRSVRDEILEIAKSSISLGDVNGFNSLNEVAVVLTELASGHGQYQQRHNSPRTLGNLNAQQVGGRIADPDPEPAQSGSLIQILPVYAIYLGSRHDGELDASRLLDNGRGHCLYFRGNWMTPAKATSLINTKRPSAWRFWRYTRSDGTEGRIQEIKDSRLTASKHSRPSYPSTYPTSEGIRSAIYAELSNNSPLHRRVILERVLERGIQVGGQDPLTHISAHLSKDARFQGVGDGYWSLSPEGLEPVGANGTRYKDNLVNSPVSAAEMRDTVFDILSSERPLHRRAIYERLLDQGIHVGGRSPINNFGAHMSADPRMKSNGSGYWTLTSEFTDSQGELESIEEFDEEEVPW